MPERDFVLRHWRRLRAPQSHYEPHPYHEPRPVRTSLGSPI